MCEITVLLFVFFPMYATGSERPDLAHLATVRSLFEADWYEIGLNLLNQDDAHRLDLIKINGKDNTSECCREMLKLWLRKQPKATWDQLIRALRSEGVERNDVAYKIKKKLIKGKIYASLLTIDVFITSVCIV